MTDTLIRRATVARRLGLGYYHVKTLDRHLKPIFNEKGTRLYRADVVDRYAARRHAAKEKR